MNQDLIREYRDKALRMSPYPNPNFPPSLYYRFLKVLAQDLKPRLAVELGVAGGGGSLHMCLGCQSSKVVGIDIVKEVPDNIDYIGIRCPNFEFWLGDSVELAKAVHDEHGPVDLLFVDTTHTEDRTWREYFAWLPYLSDGAIVCLDDLLREEMGTFWDDLEEPKLRLDELHATAEGGFGVKWFG
jgi:predicted O-methyltransferase YrrM